MLLCLVLPKKRLGFVLQSIVTLLTNPDVLRRIWFEFRLLVARMVWVSVLAVLGSHCQRGAVERYWDLGN